ncbi:MAG: fused MFS/spermidine synthase [Alphaproteobacteria bacterium]|nr:fused MFS/spermidine synthase [Alphaproteobacteria bacterium]
MLLFAGTVFSSAFLLFLVQPIIAKQILPWFGGSSMVWSICLVFFQGVLLAGYAYADGIARRLAPPVQAAVHVLLLFAAVVTLPIVADASWKPTGGEDPTWRILGLLFATIGLPYFLLSATGPLVQSWRAGAMRGKTVYRLFSLSNLASLLALAGYPFLVEPHISVLAQGAIWSAVFLCFALLCAGSAILFVRDGRREADIETREGASPGMREMALWCALSGMGSWMLLAVSNHITQDVAPVPFLWLLPLSLYLATFVLCFEREGWYRRNLYLPVVAGLLGVCAWGLQDDSLHFEIRIAVPLYMAGLFALCMFLHGELARRKPGPRHLTRYYLMLSLGGALGGAMVGLVAPRVLPSYYELGIGFVLVPLLAAVLFYRGSRVLALAAVALSVLCAVFLAFQVAKEFRDTTEVTRNFHGTLRVRDKDLHKAGRGVRQLLHGAILHGEQFVAPARRMEPTTYYGVSGGVGLLIGEMRGAPLRVGVIGMGIGTMAAHGRPGDVFRFYELNPKVIEIAHREFSFLKESRAGIEIVPGDARLSLEGETLQAFDLLVVDAFSGDAIPVHLLTREAMGLYLRHLKPGGVIAIHVTNRFLTLAPQVRVLARLFGLEAVRVRDKASDSAFLYRSEWVLVSRDRELLTRRKIREKIVPFADIPRLRPWTDDFNNLFDILK